MFYIIFKNIKILQTIVLLSCLWISLGECVYKVNGRCGRPGLPSKAGLWLITPERSRFDNNEKVLIDCQKNEFPNHAQERVCKNGMWTGKIARCGQHIDAQVINLEIYSCDSSTNTRLVSQALNQTLESPPDYPPLRPNSYHSSRVDLDKTISANGSMCYIWKIKFDRKVQIWFLLIDIFFPNNNSTQLLPDLTPFVSKYRTCSLEKRAKQTVSNDALVGYYYFCDLTSDLGTKAELTDMLDTITVHINTTFEEEIGLEAVFIGDIYRTSGNSKLVKPDCGHIAVQNTGVEDLPGFGYTYISCNDSFTDENGLDAKDGLSAVGNPRHKFICNSNGQWVGEWPLCVPKISCSKKEIIDDMGNSLVIEEIGNVYYLNQSQWYAINDSWVRYTCVKENDIMIGKNIRSCMKDGQWSNKMPYCTSASLSGFAISGILFAVLMVFVLIVLFVFRTHSKKVKRELRETRNEIKEETARKRMSDEFYAEVGGDDMYYDNTVVPNTGRKSLAYDTYEYEMIPEQPRYNTAPFTPHDPEYIVMLANH